MPKYPATCLPSHKRAIVTAKVVAAASRGHSFEMSAKSGA